MPRSRFVALLWCAIAGCTGEQEPPPEAPAIEPVAEEARSDAPAPRARVAPLAKADVRLEVRPSGEFGGGDGWISSRNVGGLETSIGIARGRPADLHVSTALKALSMDTGRLPEKMAKRMGTLAVDAPDKRAVGATKLFEENVELFHDVCGDVASVYWPAPELNADQRKAAVFDDCHLGRFGILTREQALHSLTLDALLGFAVLVHLNRLGGPHPTEEALIKLLVGVPADLALGKGPKIEHPFLRRVEPGWAEYSPELEGFKASFPEPPSKSTEQELLLSSELTKIMYWTVEDDVLLAVHHTDFSDVKDFDARRGMEAVAEQDGGQVVEQADVKFAGQPALAIVKTQDRHGGEYRLESRIFFKGDRLYHIMVGYPPGKADVPVKKFFDGFALLP